MAKPKRSGREARGRGEEGAGVQADSPKTSPLVGAGGKVDKGAVFRAARAAAESAATRGPTSTDPDLVDAAVEPITDDDEAAPGEMAGVAGAAGIGPAPKVVFRLSRDLDKRLDKYLTDRITFMSRAQLQRLIEDGGVLVNGRKAKSSTNLRLDDVVEVSVPPPRAEDIVPEDIALEVMFEDEHMVVVNKSPDIIVHPARSHLSGTMVNALAYHFRNRSATGGSLSGVGRQFARPGVVHRLDRQTSGVIVFAKTEQAHWQLANQFMARTVDKRYVAIAHGWVAPPIEFVDLPLGPHPSRERGYREKHVVRHDHLGKPAVTVWRVLGRYGVQDFGAAGIGGVASGGGARGDAFSLIEIELRTGRTHQIRVHLSHLGFPLAGDDMYGGAMVTHEGRTVFGRVALHAARLAVRHPTSGAPMVFEAPFPADLGDALAWMRSMAVVEEPSPPPGAMLSIATLAGDRPRD